MNLTDALPDPDTPLPLQQSAEFAKALRLMGRDAQALTIRDGRRRIGHIVLIGRHVPGLRTAYFTSRGPIWAGPLPVNLRHRALLHLRHEGLLLANGDSEAETDIFRISGYRRIVSGASVAELNLRPAGDWRRHTHGKWRNRLRRAERGAADVDLSTHPFQPTADARLLQNCAKMARKRGYQHLPEAFTSAFGAANPGAAQTFVAHQGGYMIAGIVVLRHGATATYHLGWNSEQGRVADAHRLLLSRAADWLRERGHRRLDLGTIDTENAPGLARFKLGAGAQSRKLSGSWLRMPFAASKAHNGRLPGDVGAPSEACRNY